MHNKYSVLETICPTPVRGKIDFHETSSGAINGRDCCFNGSVAHLRSQHLTTAIVCFGLAESRIWVSGDSSSLYPSWQHNSEHCPLSKASIFVPCIHASIPLCCSASYHSLPGKLLLVGKSPHQHHCSCEMYPTSVKFSLVCPLGPQGSLYISNAQYLSLCHVSSYKLFSGYPHDVLTISSIAHGPMGSPPLHGLYPVL